MTGIIHICIAGFFYQRAHFSRFGRKFKYSVHLMSALVIFKSHGTAVGIPFGTIYFILSVEQFSRRNNASSAFHFIDAGHFKRKFVSRLRILLFVKLGLKLVSRRRFHIINIALFHRTDLAGSHLLTVR